jgi:hypothetical protein
VCALAGAPARGFNPWATAPPFHKGRRHTAARPALAGLKPQGPDLLLENLPQVPSGILAPPAYHDRAWSWPVQGQEFPLLANLHRHPHFGR